MQNENLTFKTSRKKSSLFEVLAMLFIDCNLNNALALVNCPNLENLQCLLGVIFNYFKIVMFACSCLLTSVLIIQKQNIFENNIIIQLQHNNFNLTKC